MNFVKGFLYHVLLWLRGVFKIVFILSGSLFFLVAIGELIFGGVGNTGGREWGTIALYFGLSFLNYLLSYSYDKLIIKLAPKPKYPYPDIYVKE